MPCVLVAPQGSGGGGGGGGEGARLHYAVLLCSEPTPRLPVGATPSEPEGGAAGDPQRGQNDTGLPEQFSHLDAPNDSLYVLCGVVIAMLLVGLIIVLLAVTISKLRKRDEPAAVAQEVVLHTTAPPAPPPPPPPPVTIATIFGGDSAPLATPAAATTAPAAAPSLLGSSNAPALLAPSAAPAPPPLLWQYPAPYALYGTEQDTPVHGVLPAERPGFCRGFRRSLRGRWRRLVRRKPEGDPYALPAEVRDQLKQIYVY